MTAASFQVITVLLITHLAGFAAWSGLLLAFLIQRVSDSRTAGRLLSACLVAMVVTLVAGWTLAFVEQGPPGHWSWAVNSMQALGIVMSVILLVARFGALILLQEAEDRREPEISDAAARRLTRLVAMNLALAAVTLAIATIGRYG